MKLLLFTIDFIFLDRNFTKSILYFSVVNIYLIFDSGYRSWLDKYLVIFIVYIIAYVAYSCNFFCCYKRINVKWDFS